MGGLGCGGGIRREERGKDGMRRDEREESPLRDCWSRFWRASQWYGLVLKQMEIKSSVGRNGASSFLWEYVGEWESCGFMLQHLFCFCHALPSLRSNFFFFVSFLISPFAHFPSVRFFFPCFHSCIFGLSAFKFPSAFFTGRTHDYDF